MSIIEAKCFFLSLRPSRMTSSLSSDLFSHPMLELSRAFSILDPLMPLHPADIFISCGIGINLCTNLQCVTEINPSPACPGDCFWIKAFVIWVLKQTSSVLRKGEQMSCVLEFPERLQTLTSVPPNGSFTFFVIHFVFLNLWVFSPHSLGGLFVTSSKSPVRCKGRTVER